MRDVEIKKQMMELWKETFHDSEEYIKLVFDSYFSPEMVEYEEREGKIVAALLAVPYTFGKNNSIKAAYLCGLATRKEHRGEGIMSRLMERISYRLKEKGFTFLFLIPADEGLARYYEDRGFIPGFYRQKKFYTSLHDFLKGNNDLKNKLKCCIFSQENKIILNEKLDGIIQFILENENTREDLFLNQTKPQIKTFIMENILSDGEIYVAYNSEDEIQGVCIYVRDQTGERIIEKERYVNSSDTLNVIRSACKNKHAANSMTIEFIGKDFVTQKSLWSPVYSTVMPEAPQVGAIGEADRVYNDNQYSEIYGMVKILRVSEILKFLNNISADLKYSILTKQQKSENIIKFTNYEGEFREEIIEKDKLSKEAMIDVIPMQDLAKIIFRRPGGDRIIEEIFGLPALNGQISMLLD